MPTVKLIDRDGNEKVGDYAISTRIIKSSIVEPMRSNSPEMQAVMAAHWTDRLSAEVREVCSRMLVVEYEITRDQSEGVEFVYREVSRKEPKK